MKKLRKNKILTKKSEAKKLPQEAGIYIFWDKSKTAIYIGKANNLRSRLSSYFLVNLSEKTARMVSAACDISFVQVSSELEALLLEAKLVSTYKPKFNAALKDDKHPLYIRITKEKYPRVLTARSIHKKEPSVAFYGPFPSSKNVRSVLQMTRRIFSYSQHKIGKRGCIYSQIGFCNPCPNIIEKTQDKFEKNTLSKKYKKNISLIKRLFDGNLKSVRKDLERNMSKLAKLENYEEAKSVRDQIDKLDYTTQHITSPEKFLENPNLLEDIRKKELTNLKDLINQSGKNFGKKNYLEILKRIECFDVAHLAGTNPAASMVTFINGQPDKSLYRHFKIRQKKGQSDFDSMAEVATRRVNNLKKWGRPDLVVVDGGKAQVSAFLKVFGKTKIPIIGTAKQSETLIIPITKVNSRLTRSDAVTNNSIRYEKIKLENINALNLVKRLRNEAHRFARRYHHHLVKRQLLNVKT